MSADHCLRDDLRAAAVNVRTQDLRQFAGPAAFLSQSWRFAPFQPADRTNHGGVSMATSIRLALKSGQQIYINGAILRADRKVTIELLNKAAFLLAQHIIPSDQANTPLKRLYFLIQSALIEPNQSAAIEPLIGEQLAYLATQCDDARLIAGLEAVGRCLRQKCHFDALKTLRGLFPFEVTGLEHQSAVPETNGSAALIP